MSTLIEALKTCQGRVEKYKPQAKKIGEQNTKASLIEPVISALGWDNADPDEVHREYRRKGTDNPVDYALLLLRTPRLFVEAKGLGENINDPKWANQTISYAAVAGVEWVALTDGNEWRIYNAHAPVPVEKKLFRTVRLDADIEATAATLELLSKPNMAENRIEVLWKSQFVDRQVRGVLEDLFGEDPPAGFVSLIRKRLSTLAPKEIRGSLGRLHVNFDFPAVTPVPLDPQPVTPPITPQVSPPPSVKPAKKEKVKRSAEETNTKLSDLLADGFLQAPLTLTANYDGQTFTASADIHGKVTFDGQVFETPSGAGRAVRLKVKGPDAPASVLATDGWDFWRAKDTAGTLVKLAELRRRYVQQNAK